MKNCFNILTFVLFLSLTFTLSAQVNWTKYSGNPVMGPGPTGSWDDLDLGLTCVILVGDTYHMWYDGNYNETGTINNGIGHASSLDGIHWLKDTLNPVLTPDPSENWEKYRVSQVSVLFNSSDSLFHMWYGGWGGNNTPSYFGYATSTDGGHWIRNANNPVLSPGSPGSWDDLTIIAPTVILLNDTLHMWYDGWKDGSNLFKIGHATSVNGISWEKDSSNPVLSPGYSYNWDFSEVRAAKVMHDGSRFHMFYVGGSWLSYDIGYAYSTDGSNWTKYDDPATTNALYNKSDPVIKKGALNDWDDNFVWTGSVLFNTNRDSLKMWYSGGSGGVLSAQIGYATSLFDTSFIIDKIDDLNENFPNHYVLLQNYPNPCNPSTTIKFTIPKSEYVELKVYNILGKEISTLVSRKLNQGNHIYTFDGKNLASGIYYYQLVAGDYREVKKMILLR